MPQHPRTLTQLFVEAVDEHDRPNAMQAKVGGSYQPISHRTIADRVRHVAFGLRALGVAPGDRVGILSENRPEWAIADYACLMGGMTDVPIYPTLPPEQIAYILRDSGAVAIFVSTKEQAEKIATVKSDLPALQHLIVLDDDAATGAAIRLAALEAKGAATMSPGGAAEYRAAALAITPDQVATIIYTSGTTGDPKGAMLTHGNIASNVSAVIDLLEMTPQDSSLSFLPLSHIFERMTDYLMFASGVSIAYAESMDTHLREDPCPDHGHGDARGRRQACDLPLGQRSRGAVGERRAARGKAGNGSRARTSHCGQAGIRQGARGGGRPAAVLRVRLGAVIG